MTLEKYLREKLVKLSVANVEILAKYFLTDLHTLFRRWRTLDGERYDSMEEAMEHNIELFKQEAGSWEVEMC